MEQPHQECGSALAYRVRVSLSGIRPEIWRLLDVSGELSLAELHEILQIAFGWRLGRSHVFIRSDGQRWSDGRWYGEGGAGEDERTTSLAQALTPQAGWLAYLYDPRAGWQHVVRLVTVQAMEPDLPPAHLVSGARHGPLEDVGGPQGYAELLSDLEDTAGPRHATTQAWLNGTIGPWHRSFDPDHFDAASVNRGLATRFSPDPGHRPAENTRLVALQRRIFPGLRGEFADFVAQAELDRPVTIAADQAAQMTQLITWQLSVIVAGEVRLSESGRLPTELDAESSPRGRLTFDEPRPPVPDLLRGVMRWELARKRGGRVELTPTGRQVMADPRRLWWHLARHWLPTGRVTAAGDASTLLLLELAVGAHVSGEAVADSVAFGLDSLGWVDPVNHASIYQDLVWSLLTSDLPLLRAVGVIGTGPAEQALATGPQARAFARAALQAHGEQSAMDAPRADAGPWRRRPTPRVKTPHQRTSGG